MKLAVFRPGSIPMVFAAAFSLIGSAGAVIVDGDLGTGNNNTDPAVLQSYLSSNSYASFGYWNNLVRVGDASGVYLGYNATSMTGWILSAAHITPDPLTITVAGMNYTVTNTEAVGGTDLILYEIGGLGDPALPTLPTVVLSSASATSGEFALMTGRGFTPSNAASGPYPWGTPGTDDANGMRWGTNVVEFNANVDGNDYVVTDFDATGATAYEAQASLGDSGGGLFIYRGGQWVLGGIAHFVDDGPTFLESESGPVDPAEHGDFTGYTDVFAYRNAINGITGTLIPEPSSAMLLIGGALGLAIRRRR